MKKLFYSTLLVTLLALPTTSVLANQEIHVLIDGEKLHYDSQPIIKNGSTLVPLRTTFEALNADVTWDPNSNTVTSIKDNITVSLVIGNKNATKNGSNISLSVAPEIINDRTYVPLRFVAESFGADVKWFPETNVVSIISEPRIFTDYVPYSASDLGDLAKNISKGNVVKINGQYYATPEYATNFANVHTASYSPSGDPEALSKRYSMADLDTSELTWTAPSYDNDISSNTSNIDGIVVGSIPEKSSNNYTSSNTSSNTSNIDGIVAGSKTEKISNYDYINKPWISKNDLNAYYGIDFLWLGEKIVFDKSGTTVYTLVGSPKSTFETNKIYTSDGINYKYDNGICFKYDDLVTKGIIK